MKDTGNAQEKEAMIEGCVFFKSYYDAIRTLPQKNQLEIYNAIFDYMFNNADITLNNGVANAVFMLIKPSIDKSLVRYKANAKNGKMGGKNKTQLEPNANPTQTQTEPNLNPNVTQLEPKQDNKNAVGFGKDKDKAKDKDKDKAKDKDICVNAHEAHIKKFIKPTVEEIRAYCSERRNGVNANKFYDFYEAKGWMVGKTKMKDWKAAVRTWEQDGSSNSPPQQAAQPIKRYGGTYL